MATQVILQTYAATYRPDALTLSVAYQLGKDAGYACWQDAIEEAERLLELEGEPIQFPAAFVMAEETS